jgi:CheY-like chemotaxis protein
MMNPPAKSNLILMAEDDSDDQLLVRDALAETGFGLDLRFVGNGVELMDYLHQKNSYGQPASAPAPGLIILDLNMPRKDGREALREIKSDPELKKIPVVVLTTSTAEPDIARAYELGANSFISKPVAFELLVSKMKSLSQYWFDVVVLPVKP